MPYVSRGAVIQDFVSLAVTLLFAVVDARRFALYTIAASGITALVA